MFKGCRDAVLKSYMNFAFIAFQRRKNNFSSYIKPKLCRHFVKHKPEPDPKRPARLTTLLRSKIKCVYTLMTDILLVFIMSLLRSLVYRCAHFFLLCFNKLLASKFYSNLYL